MNNSKEIYDVSLMAVSGDIHIDLSVSREENIRNAIIQSQLDYKRRILVQSTDKRDVFREIITGKEFASSVVYSYKDYFYYFSNKKLGDCVFIKPIFVDVFCDGFSSREHIYQKKLKIAHLKEIKEYLQRYKNSDSYWKELNAIFNLGNDCYNKILVDTIQYEDFLQKRLIRDIQSDKRK